MTKKKITIISIIVGLAIIAAGVAGYFLLRNPNLTICDFNGDGITDEREEAVCKDKIPPQDDEEAIEKTTAGEEFVTYVYSKGIGKIAVLVQLPEVPRYGEAAPIVFDVSTWFTNINTFHNKFFAADVGAINIKHIWPGREDAQFGVASDGEYDYGGPDSIASLRDAILFAAGEKTNINGYYLDELVAMEVLYDNLGLYASSHSGVVATNVLAYHGDELGAVKYIIGRENPTIPEMYPLEIGHFDDANRRAPVYNPYYDPAGYTPTSIEVDYSTADWCVNATKYPDGRPCHRVQGAADYVQDNKGPIMWDKRYFSCPLTRALLENNVFTNTAWPNDVATADEACNIWPYRTAAFNYPKIGESLPDLKVILVFAKDDHVQAALDKPHIHQAYDGFHDTADLWTRMNPDLAYAEQMDAGYVYPTFSDNDANTEPADWNLSGSWGHPYSAETVRNMSLAAMAEMADRVQANDWSVNLDSVLFDYSPPAYVRER